MNNVIQLIKEQEKPKCNIITGGYIAPVSDRHIADPITDCDIIADISEYFISKGKLRDNLLFLLGCNCGLRCGEMLFLKWGQLVTPSGEIYEEVSFIEEKNSKKDKKTGELIKGEIVSRRVYINNVVREAIGMYMNSLENINLEDFVFKSESRSANYYSQRRAAGIGLKHDHLTRQSVDKMLKQTIKVALGYMDMHVSTHTMRKTFARQVWDNAPDSAKSDVARFLQKMLGHASIASTLHYISVTEEEMRDAYFSLELGKRKEVQKSGATIASIIPITQTHDNSKEEKNYGEICRQAEQVC